MEKKDDVFYNLMFLNNWELYDHYMDSAPLSLRQRNKYKEILDLYQHHEIDGTEVKNRLASWLSIHIFSDDRIKFINWLEELQLEEPKLKTEATLKQIKEVFIEVFGEERAKAVFFNGFTSCGCSIIKAHSVCDYEIFDFITALSKVPDLFERSFKRWSIDKLTTFNINNHEVPEDVRDNCLVVRLFYK